MRVRCFWHLLLGALCPWLPFGANLGLVGLFFGYEYLQYRYLSRRDLKDDSYLDIRETAIAYAISGIVKMIVGV